MLQYKGGNSCQLSGHVGDFRCHLDAGDNLCYFPSVDVSLRVGVLLALSLSLQPSQRADVCCGAPEHLLSNLYWTYSGSTPLKIDKSSLKTLLATQDQAYRSALETFLKNVKDDMRAMQTSINDLTTSLEFTQREVEDLKQEVKQRKEHSVSNTLMEKIDKSEERCKELEDSELSGGL